MISDTRQAAVSGQFYPAGREQLQKTVKTLMGAGPTREALGVIVPHAGYVYSGAIAGEVYGAVEMPGRFVILGPNHTGLGPAASIMAAGVWRTPLGDARVDAELAGDIKSRSGVLVVDESAHSFEHSIEVQLPFLQYLKGDVEFVPISLMVTAADSCRDIGLAIAAAIKGNPRKTLIIASSDMSHYESQAIAQEKDGLALERIGDLDPAGLLDTVMEHHISMCGAAPAAAMLFACNELGASRAKIVRYATSGDVNGDYSQVVGYAGVIVN